MLRSCAIALVLLSACIAPEGERPIPNGAPETPDLSGDGVSYWNAWYAIGEEPEIWLEPGNTLLYADKAVADLVNIRAAAGSVTVYHWQGTGWTWQDTLAAKQSAYIQTAGPTYIALFAAGEAALDVSWDTASVCFPPVEVVAAACADDKCTLTPKGKTSGQGNSAKYTVCIPSNPANNDQTCAPHLDGLYNKAATRAMKVCVDTHKVKCAKKTCKKDCRNSVKGDKKTIFLQPNDNNCKAGQDGCVLGNIGFDCTCHCPDDDVEL